MSLKSRQLEILWEKAFFLFFWYSTFDINPNDWPNPPARGDLSYNDTTKAYTRLYSENGIPVMGQGFNLKPRETKFWTSVIPNLHSQINRTLATWDPNRDKTTADPTYSPRPRGPSANEEDLLRQKNIFLILFIIFFVLACLLLFVLLYMSALLYYSKNSTKYCTS